MPKQRLINCDFFATSGFTKNLSNKAKLLYFFFLTNADDKGFVGNGVDIADTLDFCEEHFENVLFQFKYVDALKELEEKRLVFKFVDRVGNIVYLIRHWFLHNKNQKYLTTNYLSYLSQVELINNEYYLKSEKEKPLKEKENKETKELDTEKLCQKSCLDYEELEEYLSKKGKGCAWHIDNLVIFDEPKELSEFKAQYGNKEYGYYLKPLTCAPQSYCYIEIE